jgi:Transposase domain (DUF772)
MRRFVEQADRGQWTLLPECLDDFIDESNPVRVIDVFVDALDLAEMSFEGVEPPATGRPSYHPSVLLKLYIYGYLNRVQSSRRLERERPDAMSRSCGCWVGSHLITRRSRTSAKTMAWRFARYVPASSNSAARWAFSRRLGERRRELRHRHDGRPIEQCVPRRARTGVRPYPSGRSKVGRSTTDHRG